MPKFKSIKSAIPLLSKSKININRLNRLGSGTTHDVYEGQVRRRGKKTEEVAIKLPHDGRNFPKPSKKTIINANRVWLAFHKAGLPVARYSKLDLRAKSETHLGIIQPNLRKKHGSLESVHDGMGAPVFLERLRLHKDRKLLDELATDIATIHNMGFKPWEVDFWEFYKKGNSHGRIIIDTGGFTNKKNIPYPFIPKNFITRVRQHLGKREFAYFIKIYEQRRKQKL